VVRAVTRRRGWYRARLRRPAPRNIGRTCDVFGVSCKAAATERLHSSQELKDEILIRVLRSAIGQRVARIGRPHFKAVTAMTRGIGGSQNFDAGMSSANVVSKRLVYMTPGASKE